MPGKRWLRWSGALAWVAVCGALGWWLIGSELVSQLRVEEPGNRDYEEYLATRQMSYAFGGVVGLAAGLIPLSVIWARQKRRQTFQDEVQKHALRSREPHA